MVEAIGDQDWLSGLTIGRTCQPCASRRAQAVARCAATSRIAACHTPSNDSQF
jgi:hypothetical protein